MSRFALPSPGSRSAAAELARLLDAAAPSGVRPVGDPGSPVALAGLAHRLQAAAPDAAPRPEFRAALRTRLLAVASVQGSGPAPVRAAALEGAVGWSRALRARRGVGVAVGAMASVVAVAAVGAAGARSLPGEPFYGVKRAGEGLELRAAGGPLERGTTHLEHAGERLEEVARLVGRGDVVALSAGSGPVAGAGRAELVVRTLDDMDEDTLDGHRLLTEASDGGTDSGPLEVLTTFSARQDRALAELAPSLPLDARARVERSQALVAEVSAQAVGLLLEALPPAPATAPDSAVDAAADPAVPTPPPLGSDPLPVPGAPAVTAEEPGPAPSASQAPAGPEREREPTAEPGQEPDDAPAPPPATSRPVPAPSGGVDVPTLPPLPVPVPVPPLPTRAPLPVPVPTVPTVPPLPVPTLPPVPGVPGLPALSGAPALLQAAAAEPVPVEVRLDAAPPRLDAGDDPGLRVPGPAAD